ncbi:unnamed protein product [Chironomus riparius]|uniref:Uncharacterized protein n=1 Tax=Chironomus riparius TaxID=315576 RepID=A0A9N9WTH3_9DIPT|nr:unnamed protein product [Chironomus riparius]
MKFQFNIFIFVATFVAGSNAGGPSEPQVCTVVAEVAYEFNSFTTNLLRLYILNLPRSDEASSDEKLLGMASIVEGSADVPEEDKKTMHDLVNHENRFDGRSLADGLTHDNIWDCFIGIFTGALDGVLAI